MAGTAALPEIGRIVPALEGYALAPTFDVKANGPLDRLALGLDVRSQAGNASGTVTADLRSPDLSAQGDVDLERLNLAPLLKDPSQRSDLTGHAKIDLTLASAPEAAPALERLQGSFAFDGPRVFAAGSQATLAGRRITLDGRAAAYGGTGTASGFIVLPSEGRSIAFDLRGRASGVDLRQLPPVANAPKIATDLNASECHVSAAGGRIDGSATLESSEVEGATLTAGTVAQFAVAKGTVAYASTGTVAGVNLQRIGQAFHIAALDAPRYDARLNGAFDVKGP